MFTSFVFIVAGFALLIKGADYLIDGASSIARKFGVSSLVIGLTVVAFGTSAPELAVNVLAALGGNSDISLGNINGSNIANILLILGATAIVSQIPVKSRTVIKEIPFMILSSLVLLIITMDHLLIGPSVSADLSRIDGLVLLCFFGIFMYYLLLSAKDVPSARVHTEHHPLWYSSGLAVMGLVGLVLGGHLAVTGAVDLALLFGVSEGLIAVTVIAFGTSLPELVSSIVAARKGETDMAIGGVVGSNIFNILMVLGVTATINPMLVPRQALADTAISFVVMVILLTALFIRTSKTTAKPMRRLDTNSGYVFIGLYIAYIVFSIAQG